MSALEVHDIMHIAERSALEQCPIERRADLDSLAVLAPNAVDVSHLRQAASAVLLQLLVPKP